LSFFNCFELPHPPAERSEFPLDLSTVGIGVPIEKDSLGLCLQRQSFKLFDRRPSANDQSSPYFR